MKLTVHAENWRTKTPFRITGYTMNAFNTIVVEIGDGTHVGVGEAHGVFYLEETQDSMIDQIESIRDRIEASISREELLETLPPGGARNAIDCALWDLEAKQTSTNVWKLAGVAPNPIITVFSIGIEDTPEQMAANAAAAAFAPALKIKLDNVQPVERITAIRSARPDALIVVDVNQGWNFDELVEYAPKFAELNVSMLEQPLKRGGDAELEDYRAPLPLYADESCLDRSDLADAVKRYDGINIKLDKAGGLTEALLLAEASKAAGKELMVGCMGGTSNAMAPAHVVGQLCRFVDIDAPLLLKTDRLHGLAYNNGEVTIPEAFAWGK